MLLMGSLQGCSVFRTRLEEDGVFEGGSQGWGGFNLVSISRSLRRQSPVILTGIPGAGPQIQMVHQGLENVLVGLQLWRIASQGVDDLVEDPIGDQRLLGGQDVEINEGVRLSFYHNEVTMS